VSYTEATGDSADIDLDEIVAETLTWLHGTPRRSTGEKGS